MGNRPRIRIKLVLADKVMEVIGFMTLLCLWIISIYGYRILPDRIPTHFTASGHVDDMGHKVSIVFLPVIGTILFVAMTILNKYPHVFNYPAEITDDNAEKQYTMATRIIRYLKFVVVLVFAMLVFMTIQTSEGKTAGLGSLFLPFTLCVVFLPLIYYIMNVRKSNT